MAIVEPLRVQYEGDLYKQLGVASPVLAEIETAAKICSRYFALREIPLLLEYCSSRERSNRSCPIASCQRGCCGEALPIGITISLNPHPAQDPHTAQMYLRPVFVHETGHFARYTYRGSRSFIKNVGHFILLEGIAEYCRRTICPDPEALPRLYSDKRAEKLYREALADINQPENSPRWKRWKNSNPNFRYDAYEAGYYAVNRFMEQTGLPLERLLVVSDSYFFNTLLENFPIT